MKAGELLDILDKIKGNGDGNTTDVAKKASVDRSYLSKLINGDANKELEGSLLRKIQKAYPQYFTGNNINNDIKAKITSHEALLSVIISELAAIKASISEEHSEVILKKIYKAAEDVEKIMRKELA